MLTTEALRGFGANTDEGLNRCLNNEAFYLRLVKMAAADGGYDKLGQALEAGDFPGAFEAAHGLKGTLGNLSLTPLYKPAAELTELLRAGKPVDCSALWEEIRQRRAELAALCED